MMLLCFSPLSSLPVALLGFYSRCQTDYDHKILSYHFIQKEYGPNFKMNEGLDFFWRWLPFKRDHDVVWHLNKNLGVLLRWVEYVDS